MTVAALYVDPRGPYPTLAGVDCWGINRDARLYNGPYPAVLHPPCGPWESFRKYCTEDLSCALRAVEQVREFGGVLEHPRGSTLWRVAGLPAPNTDLDIHGGWSLVVEQVSWGHVARKPTILYLVGVDRELALSTMRTGGEPTHAIGRPGKAAAAAAGYTWPCLKLKATSSQQNRRTPKAFAEWLVMLARSTR